MSDVAKTVCVNMKAMTIECEGGECSTEIANEKIFCGSGYTEIMKHAVEYAAKFLDSCKNGGCSILICPINLKPAASVERNQKMIEEKEVGLPGMDSNL